jgi:hypothetical protein
MSASESPSSSDSWTFDDARREFKQLLEAARPPLPTLARPAAWPFAAAWRSTAASRAVVP